MPEAGPEWGEMSEPRRVSPSPVEEEVGAKPPVVLVVEVVGAYPPAVPVVEVYPPVVPVVVGSPLEAAMRCWDASSRLPASYGSPAFVFPVRPESGSWLRSPAALVRVVAWPCCPCPPCSPKRAVAALAARWIVSMVAMMW